MATHPRPIRIQRTPGGTLMWFLSARTSVAAIVLLVVLLGAGLLALTRPWERFTDPQVEIVFVPIPVNAPTTGSPQDIDGDGAPDAEELTSGTDPGDPGSVPDEQDTSQDGDVQIPTVETPR